MLENVIVALNSVGGPWGEAMWRACWQGGLALLAAWLVCRLFRKVPAGVQCWLWRVAYVKLLIALLWAGTVALPVLPGLSPVAALPRSVTTALTVLPAAPPSPAVEATALPEIPPVTLEPGNALPVAPAVEVPSAKPALLPSVPGALFLLWLLGVGWGARRLWMARGEARRILRSARPLQDDAAHEVLAGLCARFRLRSIPRLATGGVASPVLLGARRPLIVLPAGVGQSELSMMLAHELAHVQRRDLAWNGLAAVVETVFFFHPLLWPARREGRLAQEMACDVLAVERTATPPSAYAAMLVSVAASGRAAPDLLAAGISESYRTLARRLAALGAHARLTPRRLLALGASLLLLAALVLVPWRLGHGEQPLPDAPIEPLDMTLTGIPIENTAGKKPELTFKEPVYQNMPVWVSITSVNIRYPFRSEPWFAWGHDFEVMRDGKPLPRVKNAGHFPSPFYSVGFWGGSINVPNAPAGRLPLHLWYRFDKPGTYRVRYIRHDDHWSPGAFSTDGEGNIVPSKIVQATDWVTLEIKPFSTKQRKTWQKQQIANLPRDPGKLVGDALPSLLASPDETSLPAFLRSIKHKDKIVQQYAVHSLRYFNQAVLKQGMRDAGIFMTEEREKIIKDLDDIELSQERADTIWNSAWIEEQRIVFDSLTVTKPIASTRQLPFTSLEGRIVTPMSIRWSYRPHGGAKLLPAHLNSMEFLKDEQTKQLLRVTLPAEPKIVEGAWPDGLRAAFSGFPAKPPKVSLVQALKIIAAQRKDDTARLTVAQRIDAYHLLLDGQPRWVISAQGNGQIIRYVIDAESGKIVQAVP
jgi:beta-lactamase regulating signal transducer with metallopeptidase domain